MSDRKFTALAVWTAAAGTTLGSGIVHGWPGWIAVGAAMSAVCPWGFGVAALVRAHRPARKP